MQKHSFWSGLFVFGFALLALFWIIPNYAGTSLMAGMPPDLLPRLAAGLMAVSSFFVVLIAAVGMYRSGESLVSADIDWAALGWIVWPFLYVAAAVYLLTLYKITYVGAPIIAGMLLLYGERRWWLILVCAAAPVGLLYLLSVYLMRVGVV
jgi:hypothetical protein